MSIHVCICLFKGRAEYHLRYPGMTEAEAQKLADAINIGTIDSVARLQAECDALLEFAQAVARYAGSAGDDYLAEKARSAIAKATGGNDA